MDPASAFAFLLAAFTAPDMEPDGPLCRANGQWYRQGEIACIEPPCMAPRLSRCGMVLNNSAWVKIEDGCPTTSAPPDGSFLTATSGFPPLPQDRCGR
ncbi:hypothetical protein GRZ55_04900 [Chelativorans sp. ZYF759]|uniref:hypothetical protein n=1 Tax=Chelativorans sp. ZYF759 TaxID=2692213 RepID=UPI00145DE930|nr:hypothetical protein [Chelativorans sp. ZYF759]NMG38582.1 hypothetical protein [Chelativorans sp. ZYF759]